MPIAVTLNRLGRHVAQNFFRGQFFRNVAVVLTGAALSQAITIALSPIVSRLFSPAAFGVLGTFMAVLGLIGPITTLAYSAAIVLPKHDEDSSAVVWLSLLISAVVSIITFFVVVVFDSYILVDWLEPVRVLLYCLPVVILFEGLFQIAQQCLIRERRYLSAAKINIMQAVLSGAAKILAGLFFPTSFSLVVVSLLAVPLNAVLCFLTLDWFRPRSWPRPSTLNKIRATAHRYVDFPLYRAPQAVVNAFSQSLPLLVLAYFHGPAAVGFFTLSNSVLGAPTQLLSKTINDVFFPRLVEASHTGERTRPLILKAAATLGATSMIPLCAIAVAGPFFFQHVFGARWSEAGEYAQWLSLFTFSTLILRPGLSAVPILHLQGVYLTFEIVSTVLKLASLSVTLITEFRPIVPVALFSTIGALSNILFFWYVALKSAEVDAGKSRLRV
jgi:O-antigen/teichoic acid export membrane protein